MKLFCVFVVFALNVFPVLVESFWVGFQRDSKKNHSGHCFESIHSLGPLEIGEIRRIETMCAVATCLEDKNIKYSGCPIISTHANCTVSEGDLSKIYPDCCFELECYDDDDDETTDISSATTPTESTTNISGDNTTTEAENS